MTSRSGQADLVRLSRGIDVSLAQLTPHSQKTDGAIGSRVTAHRQTGLHGTAHRGSAKRGKSMRFDLLDEYSTLVPFRLGISRGVSRGVSRSEAFQDPAVPARAAKRGTIANFAGHLELLHKLLGALRQMVLSN